MKTDDGRADVAEALQHDLGVTVDVEHAPTHKQLDFWRPLVEWQLGVDDEGWFQGYCPFHDQGKKEPGSAWFDFEKGMVYCTAHPNCFAQPGRRERRCIACDEVHSMVNSMSMSNVMQKLAEEYLAQLG